MLIGLLIFGSIMIIACLSLQKNIDVLQYSLMPIMGSLALSRAATILIIDMPALSTKRWILDSIEKNNVISFEYDHNSNSTSEGDQEKANQRMHEESN